MRQTLCAIWNYLCNLKSVKKKKKKKKQKKNKKFKKKKKKKKKKKNDEEVLLLITIFHLCCSRPLNCTNGTKLRKASHEV